MPKEGIIFGLLSNNVLYCGSKTVSYVGFEGFDFNLRANCIESLRRLLLKDGSLASAKRLFEGEVLKAPKASLVIIYKALYEHYY